MSSPGDPFDPSLVAGFGQRDPYYRPARIFTQGPLVEVENALITRAQSALARRQPSGALEALRTHAEQFPDGQLVEEREAMWVQALASTGDLDGARARAARFHRRFPDSPLGPAVDAAVVERP